LLAAELKKQGVTILVDTRVDKVSVGPDQVTTSLASGEPIISEKVLVSVGRRFNTAGLGLEDAGVVLGGRGEILVNERMETNHRSIYAIGDVVGKAMLAHVASAQGKVAVRNILGQPAEMRYDVVPAGISSARMLRTSCTKSRWRCRWARRQKRSPKRSMPIPPCPKVSWRRPKTSRAWPFIWPGGG